MCSRDTDCGAQASCVAGRCVAHGGTAAIDSARRLIFAPVDVAYIRRSAAPSDSGIAVLGCARDDGALALLRFSAAIPPEVNVLEAYLLLERVLGVDADPVPIALHAARIVDPWDGRSVSWARQPRIQEVGASVTRVAPAAGPLVRLDVGELVQRWRRRARDDFGIAVLAEGASSSGMAFALSPLTGVQDRQDPVLSPPSGPASQTASPFEPRAVAPSTVGNPRSQLVGPRLELYVK